jgi:hypothetical protein
VWSDLRAALALFPSIVLTWLDDAGYPVSVRLAVEPVDTGQVLRFPVPAGLELRSGPASVMSHSHDEETWHLRTFMTRGFLEHDGEGWLFRPLTYIPGASGAGLGGFAQQIRIGFRARSTAKRYLAKRGLARPAIPWDKIKAL